MEAPAHPGGEGVSPRCWEEVWMEAEGGGGQDDLPSQPSLIF